MISIHALREEGDDRPASWPVVAGRFLSTPSARRATESALRWADVSAISIHALREEGDGAGLLDDAVQVISIHALREEGDALTHEEYVDAINISIHALREEGDDQNGSPAGRRLISIHALREEGDGAASRRRSRIRNFYPRPPRGGRPQLFCATKMPFPISIHALREEGDAAGG